jgi:uncharacterized RDD family membrane protein YckC
MLPENPSFVIRGDDGEEYGPVDLEELREWVRENRAGLGTEVRRDEPGATWNSWQTYPELIALLAEAHATGNVQPPPLEIVAAPLLKRALAFAMDLILCGFLSFPILFALALIYLPDYFTQLTTALSQAQGPIPQVPENASIVGSLISNLVLALYFAGFHAVHGFTPGKALMRLRVVDSTGEKPSFLRGFARALVLIVSMNLFFIPFLYVFFNPQRRAFHDIVSDTCVVNS